MTFKPNLVREGRLIAASLPLLWKSFPPASHATMLNLLEKFNILYPLNRSSTDSDSQSVAEYLVPCLLSDVEPEKETNAIWQEVPSESFMQHSRRFLFPTLPMGFMGRLIARVLHITSIAKVVYWRSGLVACTRASNEPAQYIRISFQQLAGTLLLLL